MNKKNIFVFVVCGADVHIKTLNYSIKCLKRFSKNEIIVVTDKSRNNIEIEHERVFDIKTPANFDHHQASIFLKTGLYKILDLFHNYCYLDSDVIGLSPKVDEIFNHQYGPVTFAADHCKIDSFSPYALNCGCSDKTHNNEKEFIETVRKLIPEYEHDLAYHSEKGRELYRILMEIKTSPLKNLGKVLNFVLTMYSLKNSCVIRNKGNVYKYDSKRNGWIDQEGNLIMYSLISISKKIVSLSGYSFSKMKMNWVNAKGEVILNTKCNHLVAEIDKKFKIDITNKNFQHWNGGVFLFNENSIDFLETWHKYSLDIFNDSAWKTRDQGTLTATVWQFGLQNQKTLPIEFNFIADYFNPNITYNNKFGFTKNNYKTTIEPNFIHVYHEFGNKNWDIWKAIEKILYEN